MHIINNNINNIKQTTVNLISKCLGLIFHILMTLNYLLIDVRRNFAKIDIEP